MKTSELVELLKTHDVTEVQLYNLLTEDLGMAVDGKSGSIADPVPQELIRFFIYQIQSVIFPVIRDLRKVLGQVQRGGQVFKDELDKGDK